MWKIEDKALEWMNAKVRPSANALTQKFQHRDATEYEVVVRAFNATPFGHNWSHQFMLRGYQLMWPDFYSLEAQNIENKWAIRKAKAFRKYKRLSLIGCASSAKSQDAACYGYWLWKSKPTSTSIYVSTTSAEAGEARMWGNIKDLFAKDRFQIGKRIDSLQLICLDQEVKDDEGVKQRDLRDSIKFVKIKTGQEGKNAIGAICGRKNDNVIWCCDEENFMDIGILDARVNLFSNAKPGSLVQFIGIGNAPSEGSPLFIDAEPNGEGFTDGYRSVDIDVHEEWPTKTGRCLYFNGNKSPNWDAPDPLKPPFPFLMNHFSKEEIRSTAMGEDTNIFWVQFYGFPPSVEVPDKVLTHKLLESNKAFEKAEWLGTPTKWVAGLDCGFRKDGDPTVIDFGRIGKATNGDTIISWEGRDGKPLLPSQKSNDPFEVQMAKLALDEMAKMKPPCVDIGIDIMGEGGMTANAMQIEAAKRGQKLNLVPISSLGSPDDKVVVPGDRRMASEVFDRKVSQIWMSVRVAAGKGLLRDMGAHTKAVQQLCERKFITDERKRFAIEGKPDMKKRLRRSPDFGDARAYTCFIALSHGLSLGVSQKAQATPLVGASAKPAPSNRYQGHGTRVLYGGR